MGNRALMAAGLVDRVQVTLFPVITGQTGLDPIFQGAADFDLELIESRTLDGTSKSSSTGPPCMSESVHASHPRAALQAVAGLVSGPRVGPQALKSVPASVIPPMPGRVGPSLPVPGLRRALLTVGGGTCG